MLFSYGVLSWPPMYRSHILRLVGITDMALDVRSCKGGAISNRHGHCVTSREKIWIFHLFYCLVSRFHLFKLLSGTVSCIAFHPHSQSYLGMCVAHDCLIPTDHHTSFLSAAMTLYLGRVDHLCQNKKRLSAHPVDQTEQYGMC